MDILLKVLALLALFAVAVPALAQTATKDPQAVTLITEVLTFAGASTPTIRDFQATGNITSLWAGGEMPGEVELRGLSLQGFRLDIIREGKKQSCVIKRYRGFCTDPYYDLIKVGFANSLTFQAMNLPYLRLVAALQDQDMQVTYVGLFEDSKRQLHRIRIQRVTNPDKDPEKLIANADSAEYLVDSTSHQLVGLQDNLHAEGDDTANRPRSLYYSDYRKVDGVLVPFRIDEYVFGQHTQTIQLTSVSLNIGLAESDFNN
jgi:hypothetical protein